MQPINRNSEYSLFRINYPEFSYEGYKADFNDVGLRIEFSFNIGGLTRFKPVSIIHFGNYREIFQQNYLRNRKLAEVIIFNIGLIELVSYWKSTCAPKIVILAGKLSEKQIDWWKKLYFNGLGEFFFLNGISPEFNDYVEIISSGDKRQRHEFSFENEGYIIPVGGGKDSAVTLELLKKLNRPIIPLIINPRQATLETVDAARLNRNSIISISRVIDPELLRINNLGFLNGHTPFSAMLAFYSLLVSLLAGNRNIALSNESSASEATIPGTHINHQYSKSFEFEQDFREYYSEFISPSFNYFSFLRPLNELQIVSVFSGLRAYHNIFKSCNVGSKTDTWCGKCPKCLFTAIMFSAFKGIEYTNAIMGADVLNDVDLVTPFDELCGFSEVKPFECVGTIDDVKNAMFMIANRSDIGSEPYLLKRFLRKKGKVPDRSIDLSAISYDHNLTPELLNILTSALL